MAFILDDILFAPVKGVNWVARTLQEHAEAELTDDSAIQQRLLDLQMQFERGEISEEEYIGQEDVLMKRLAEIRKHKESVQNR